MGFKERIATANAKAREASAKAAEKRAGQPSFKEKMAAANSELKTGLGVTKENWDGKRADLAVERSEIRDELAASRKQMTAANAELKEGLAGTKAKWDEERSVLASERAEARAEISEKRDARRADLTAKLDARKADRAAVAKPDLRAERAARKAAKGESFEGVTLAGGRVTYKGQGGPVKGATARVESAADAHRRMTATRFLFAGGVMSKRKQVGHVFLTVEGPGFEFVAEVPAKKESDARAFAAKINNAAKRGA